MQAIPSSMPLARTASLTSSVMSVTVSPPDVRRLRSSWKTFTDRNGSSDTGQSKFNRAYI